MASNLRKRTNVTFYQIVGVGVFVLTIFAVLGFILYSRLAIFFKTITGKLEAICGCANHLSFVHHPYLLASLILLSLFFIIFLAFIFKKIVDHSRATKLFVAVKTKNKKEGVSLKLKQAAEEIGLGGRVMETAESGASVFCFGFVKPRICLSSELVENLNQDELRAVLLHEKEHLFNYEPLKLFLVKSISSILFFIPSLRLMTDKYFILSELTADERATAGFNNKTPLAGAITKVIKLEERLASGGSLAVSFLGATDIRINKLLDNKYSPKFNIFTAKVLISSLAPLFVLLSFIFLADSSQALIKNHDPNYCPSMQAEEQHQCQLGEGQASCAMSYNYQYGQCNEL